MQVALYTQDQAIHALVNKVATNIGHACVSFNRANVLLDHLQKEGCDALIVDGTVNREVETLMNWARSHMPPAFPIFAISPADATAAAALLDQRITDYLTKPVRQNELALRLRVVLQRAYPERFVHTPQVFGDYVFDEASHILTVKSSPVGLTQKEFALALLFFRHLNRPLSRAFIVERIWSRNMEVSSRTIDTHVSRVRNKLGLKPENGFKLVPVYSFGYRLEALTSVADTAQ